MIVTQMICRSFRIHQRFICETGRICLKVRKAAGTCGLVKMKEFMLQADIDHAGYAV